MEERLALYRKYRPKVFDDVTGEDHITSVLKYEAANNLFSHAYLFCGPRGTGKTTCAKILSKVINCDNPHDGNPCGVCDKCRAIDEGSATDIVEIDAASHNLVDDVRVMLDELEYTPAFMKKRVYILDEVHMLSTSAFNALLKTLEEPPEHVVFILATTEFQKLPETVISRCQRYDFRRISLDKITARLEYIAGEESIQYEPDALMYIARRAQGCMRDAVNIFELCSVGRNNVTVDTVKSTLGISDIDTFVELSEAVASNSTETIFRMINDISSASKDISVFWQEIMAFWRDMIVCKVLDDPGKYFDYTDHEISLIREASAKFTKEKLLYQSDVMETAIREMKEMPQIKANIAEITLVRISDPSLDGSTSALLARISELEKQVKLLSRGYSEPAPETRPVQNDKAAAKPSADSVSADKAVEKEEIRTEIKPEGRTPSDEMTEVTDRSEFNETMNRQDHMLFTFIRDVRIFRKANGDIKIVTPNKFAYDMIMSEKEANEKKIKEALIVSDICRSDACVSYDYGRDKPEDDMFDGLL